VKRTPFLLAALSAAILVSGASGSSEGGERTTSAAAATPSLNVIPFSTRLGRTSGTDIDLFRPGGGFAQVALYVPAGFDLGVGRKPGTPAGLLTAWDTRGTAHDGDLVIDDASKHTADACAPGTHTAVWVLRFTTSTGPVELPAYIDVPSGSEAGLGAYKIVFCVPPATSLGATIDELELIPTLPNPRSRGLYRWRAFVTPYAGATADPTATYEVRSVEPLPVTLSLRAKKLGRLVSLSGYLSTKSYNRVGIPITLYTSRGGRYSPTTWTRTRAGGHYGFVRPIRKTSQYYTALQAVHACREATTAPGGCVQETLATIFSNTVTVRVRRR
jgi:hypothetical protein